MTASAPAAAGTAVDALRWRVAAASVRGTSHAATGTPCQDAHAWAAEAGLLVAAVADGAGTSPLSEHGAAAAAGAAIAFLGDAVRSGTVASAQSAVSVLADAFAHALAAVQAEADARGADVRDLATTLAVAVCAPRWMAAAQVGDGFVVIRDRTGALRTVGGAEGGEYLNETVFLTTPGALDGLRPVTADVACSHVALLTDGLQMLAMRMPGREPHVPFFDPLFRFADAQGDADDARNQLAAFLAGPRVAARADDDLTLVLASITPDQGEPR